MAGKDQAPLGPEKLPRVLLSYGFWTFCNHGSHKEVDLRAPRMEQRS